MPKIIDQGSMALPPPTIELEIQTLEEGEYAQLNANEVSKEGKTMEEQKQPPPEIEAMSLTQHITKSHSKALP